jgi:glutathione S-transferase
LQGEVARILLRLEAVLDGKEYLGSDFSLADVAFAPRIVLLSQLGIEPDARLQSVAGWIARLRERQGVKLLSQ